VNDAGTGFKVVEAEVYRHRTEFYRFVHVAYVVPTNDGRWFAGKMELCLN